MFSLTKMKIRTTVSLAAALLLCTSPLAAALKTKPGATRVRVRTAAAAPRFSASSSSRASSHKSSRAAASGTHRGGRSKVQTVKLSKPKFRGQQSIDNARTLEIQQALIREHYLDGEASGRWDATTEDAMRKYQSDQGWQTKVMPDSRALKKLGLGPDYSGAINAKHSSFTPPPPTSTIPAEQAAGFAAGSGVKE